MGWLKRMLKSGIGRKALVGLSGLAIVGFLVVHLLGNLQLFSDPDPVTGKSAFNDYAHALHDQFWLPIAEYGLLAMFLLHIGLVIWLAVDNRKARGGQGYAVAAKKQKSGVLAFLASKTMVFSGLILLVFLAVHVWDFRLQHDEIGYNLQQHIEGTLANPLHGLLYVLGSLVVGFHLYHGIQSGFRSIGVHSAKYTPLIEKVGVALALIFGLGFASLPIYIMLTN